LHLMDDRLTPVCSPSYLPKNSKPEDIDLHHFTLLQVDYPSIENEWNIWLKQAGYPSLDHFRVRVFQSLDQAYLAAVNGLGFAMGHESSLKPLVEVDKLYAPFKSCAAELAYYFVCPDDAPENVILFRDWLLSEVQA